MPLQSAVTLQGAAVRVLFALWSLAAGAATRCMLQGAAVRELLWILFAGAAAGSLRGVWSAVWILELHGAAAGCRT